MKGAIKGEAQMDYTFGRRDLGERKREREGGREGGEIVQSGEDAVRQTKRVCVVTHCPPVKFGHSNPSPLRLSQTE